MPRLVWWAPRAIIIIGGLKLTRDTQAAAMKFGLPSTTAPTIVIGMGYT